MLGDLSTMELALVAILGLVGGVAMLIASARLRGAVLPIALMLLFSCLAAAEDWAGRPITTAFTRIQVLRSELFLGAGCVVAFMALLHQGTIWRRGINWMGVVLFLMAVYAAMLRFVHEGPADGGMSLAFAGLTILPLVFVVPAMINDFRDVVRLLRWLMAAHVVWLLLVGVQILVDPSKIVIGLQYRFIGLLGNPQHAGALVAIHGGMALWLMLNDTDRKLRLFWMSLLGVDAVLVAWTGSRTGLGMAALMASGVLYPRAGRAILLMPIVAGTVIGVFSALEALGFDIFFERLASSENTRQEAWANLLEGSMESPLIGKGTEGAGDSENGYLYGFAAYGIGMVALILLLIGTVGTASLAMLRRLGSMSKAYRTIVYMSIGYFAAYFGGSFFEGYMMARVASNLVFFLVFTGIAARLIRLADEGVAAEDPTEAEARELVDEDGYPIEGALDYPEYAYADDEYSDYDYPGYGGQPA